MMQMRFSHQHCDLEQRPAHQVSAQQTCAAAMRPFHKRAARYLCLLFARTCEQLAPTHDRAARLQAAHPSLQLLVVAAVALHTIRVWTHAARLPAAHPRRAAWCPLCRVLAACASSWRLLTIALRLQAAHPRGRRSSRLDEQLGVPPAARKAVRQGGGPRQ